MKSAKFFQLITAIRELDHHQRKLRGVVIFAKAFMGIPAQQAAKTTRPPMPAAAPAVLVTRSLPNKG